MTELSATTAVYEKAQPPHTEASPTIKIDPLSSFVEFFAPTFKNPEEFILGTGEMSKELRDLGYTGTISKATLREIIVHAQHTPKQSKKLDFVRDVVENKGGLKFFSEFRSHAINKSLQTGPEEITPERKLGRQLVKAAQELQMKRDRSISSSPVIIKLTKNIPYIINRNPSAIAS